MRRTALVVFCAWSVSGCAFLDSEAERPGYTGQGAEVRYACETGGDLYVNYRRNNAIIRTQGGQIYRLPEMRSASGAFYSNGANEWRTKGREATWGTGRMVPVKCVMAPQPR